MKTRIIAVSALFLVGALATAAQKQAPKTIKEKASYGIGVNLATNFKQQKIAVVPALFARAYKESLAGQKLLMTDDDMEATIKEFVAEQKRLASGGKADPPKKDDKPKTDTVTPAPELKTKMDKLSYAAGVSVGKSFRTQGIEVDSAFLIKGFEDRLSGKKLVLTEDQIRAAMQAYQAEIMQKMMKARQAAAAANQKAGDAFLAKNKEDKSVVVLPSGLQYKILKAAEGLKPIDGDNVECNYRGTLLDGTEFDSSYKRGTPATFNVNGVIPGWTEALKLMPVGSKWQLFIPAALAYGERGSAPLIGPNATLIFEIELLAIKKQ